LLGTLILAGWWALFPRRLEQMLRRQTARMYQEGENAGVLGPPRLTLDGEWVTERTEVREVRTHWRAVERVVEDQAHLYLYVTSFSAVIVPRRAFGSEEEAKAFARLAEERRLAAHSAAG
ncbi:MAG: YcxB family protein, partial [Myxococcaceae bacterium]